MADGFVSQQACDEFWMQHALSLADKAEALGEVPVGAVLVHDGKVLAEGYNQPIHNQDSTAHAEIQVLRTAGKVVGNYRLPADTTLYVTLEPCPMCAGAMVHARVARLVFGAFDPRSGAAGTVMNIANHKDLNHRLQISGGIMEQACASRLKSFFKVRR